MSLRGVLARARKQGSAPVGVELGIVGVFIGMQVSNWNAERELNAHAIARPILRADVTLVPLLRLRIADIETRLSDLIGSNREPRRRLQSVAAEQ